MQPVAAAVVARHRLPRPEHPISTCPRLRAGISPPPYAMRALCRVRSACSREAKLSSSDAGQWAVANGSDRSSRWALAAEENLSDRVVRRLTSDSDPGVLASLAQNQSIATSHLHELARLHPELLGLIELNQNAPAALKLRVPLWKLSLTSLELFVAEVGGSTTSLLDLKSRQGIELRALAEVWDEIVPQPPPSEGP